VAVSFIGGRNLVCRCVSGLTLIRKDQGQKMGKPNNFKIFVNKKIKRPKEASQNQLRFPLLEGGVLIIVTL
jgi:hypothetical protein